MRPQTKNLVTYGKSRSGDAHNDKNMSRKSSAPRATNRTRKNSKIKSAMMPSDFSAETSENESEQPKNPDACKSTTATSGQYSPDTRHGESGDPGAPWRKRTNKTATATSAECRTIHSSAQTSGDDLVPDLARSLGNSPDFGSGEVVNTQLQTKNNPTTPFEQGNTWHRSRGKALDIDPSLISPHARLAATKRETPLKRKSHATSFTMGSERLQDPPRTTGKHQRTGGARKRLVDSLGTSEDSSMDKYPASAHDYSQMPFHSGTNRRKYRPSPEPTGNRSGDMSFAEITRQPPSTSSMLRGSRVTYARQRSFLNDSSLLDSFGDGKSDSHDLSPPRPSALHSQLLQSVAGEEDDEKSDSKPVRSIHELRQAGENARFRETVELILEDIEGSSNSVSERCDGYIRLCLKLLEPQFVRQFCEGGFEERIMESATDNFDIISASLSFCAYSLIFGSGYFSFVLSGRFWWKIMEISPLLLDSEITLLCLVDRQSTPSISKSVRHSLRTNLPRILSGVCGEQSSNKSPCFLALFGINLFLQNLRQKVRSVEPISTPLLAQLIGLLMTNNPKEEDVTQEFELFVLVLSILDSYTVLSSDPWNHSQCKSMGLLSRLRWLLYPNQFDQNRKILGLYIRVIMNITNTDPSLCKELATPELVAGLVGIVNGEFRHVPEDSAKENSSLNIVILALGALTNLAEKNESSRAMFLMPARNSTSFFQQLLQQFSYGINSLGKAHSVSEVHKNVAIGYLSILLATLCLNEEILSQVEKALDKGLALILSTTEEFMQYHQKVEQDSHPTELRGDGGPGLSTKLGQIISTLRQHGAYHQ